VYRIAETMKEMDKIFMGIIITIGTGIALSIIYVCKTTVCKRSAELDVVSAMDITYNDIYRKV
jgi:hypothetical protein